jgi:hypothetical protein
MARHKKHSSTSQGEQLPSSLATYTVELLYRCCRNATNVHTGMKMRTYAQS